MRGGTIGVLMLAGCGGSGFADVGGAIRETNFDEVRTVFHGGPYLLLFAEEVDCIDTSWAQKTYNEGAPLTDTDFVAVQFSADGDAFSTGTFSVAGDSLVTALGLMNQAGALEVERAREGTVTLDVADPDRLEGTFEVAWADGTTLRSTAFRSEYCSNMDP